MSNYFDEIVVGAGAMGSATLNNLAKLHHENLQPGKSLLLEQFRLLHTKGSSGGESRATRVATLEGKEYIPLVQRANILWQEIEKKTNRSPGTLYNPIGGLVIAPKHGNFPTSQEMGCFEKTEDIAAKHNIPYTILSSSELRKLYPQFNTSDQNIGYKEASMGFLRSDECIKAQLELAQHYGAEIHTEEKMLNFFRLSNGRLKIETSQNEYETQRLILTAGPWIPQLIGKNYSKLFTIYQKFFYWFQVEKNYIENYRPDKCPIFFWDFGQQKYMYGFPIISNDEKCIKIATDQRKVIVNPDEEIKYEKNQQNEIYKNYIQPHFKGITENCVKMASCLITTTENRHFVIDYLPHYNNQVIVVSPCSGHGFKHSAAIGEALAQLSIHHKSDIDIIGLFGNILDKLK